MHVVQVAFSWTPHAMVKAAHHSHNINSKRAGTLNLDARDKDITFSHVAEHSKTDDECFS